MDVQAPNMIFEVVTKNSDLVDGKWANWHHNLGTMNAYHGSRLENFHSILRYGLQQHLNKV
jgi:poly [ADP-ribose] polymerase 16